jgi:hypothetical protein
MQTYRVGQIWERDLRYRRIVALRLGGSGAPVESVASGSVFHVDWRRPGTGVSRKNVWSWTWNSWASKARLVSEATTN